MALLDLQINGANGVDFSAPNLTHDQVRFAYRAIQASGTERFLPTIITATPSTYERNIPLLAKVTREPEFASAIPGLHLEGPFLSAADGAIGAHNPDWVLDPDLFWLDRMQSLSNDSIAMVTLAPERVGAPEMIRELRTRRIIPALGHSIAGYTEIRIAEDAGALVWTHFGNGVPRLIERHHNPLWAALGSGLILTLIADGHHLPLELLETLLRLRGAGDLILVSDASPLCGNPPGPYELWGASVRLKSDGLLVNPGTGYLCGSAFTLNQCVNQLQQLPAFDQKTLQSLTWDNPQRLLATVSR